MSLISDLFNQSPSEKTWFLKTWFSCVEGNVGFCRLLTFSCYKSCEKTCDHLQMKADYSLPSEQTVQLQPRSKELKWNKLLTEKKISIYQSPVVYHPTPHSRLWQPEFRFSHFWTTLETTHTPAADTMFALDRMCEATIEASLTSLRKQKIQCVCVCECVLSTMKRNLLHTPQRHVQTVATATRREKTYIFPAFQIRENYWCTACETWDAAAECTHTGRSVIEKSSNFHYCIWLLFLLDKAKSLLEKG